LLPQRDERVGAHSSDSGPERSSKYEYGKRHRRNCGEPGLDATAAGDDDVQVRAYGGQQQTASCDAER
jgi:hypothetical protein